MPPESPVNEDELNELLEQFKEANGTLYQELISITGANSETLKNFISQLAKNENLNAEAIKKILTANSDSDQDLQNYLDNFLSGFEKVTNSSQDQVNNIISGFSSQSAMFQKNLEKIQAKTQELGKATELGIGNIHKLMTSLTSTYAAMAQAQGDVMNTAVYDSSAMDGRSVEGELLVELSNVSEFDGAINKFQGQIQDLSGELLNAGKYLSDVQRTRIENTRKELSLEQGILEARKLSAAVTQDANGNFLDLEKTLDKATKLSEEFNKNLREGNSHLNRQLDIGKELAVSQQQTFSAQYLSGDQISNNVKSLQQVNKELDDRLSIAGKTMYLQKEISQQQKFQAENAHKVAKAQKDLPNLLNRQKQIMDEIATTSDVTKKLELESNLSAVQNDIQGVNALVGEMDASKKVTVQLEAHTRTVGETRESTLRVGEREAHKVDITGEIDALKKANEELEKIKTEGTTKDIISNVSGGAAGRGTSHISTEQLEVLEKISDKQDVVAQLSDIQRQNLEKIKAHQEEIAKTDQFITDEKQHQVALAEKSAGLAKGAADDNARNLQNAEKLTDQLSSAQDAQIKSNTFGVYSDSAIKALDGIEEKILSTVDKIPFFGSAIKSHLEKPLRDVKDQIAEEFTNTFNSVAGEIRDIAEKQELQMLVQTETDPSKLDQMNKRLSELDDVEIKTPFEVMSAGFGDLAGKIQNIAGSLKTLFNPAMLGMAVIAGLLYTAWKRFVDLEGAAEDFRREVGLGKDQTAEVEIVARNVNTEFQKFGVNLQKSFAAASALTEQFGTLVGATRENVEMVALMSANLGVSEANASGALDILSQIGDGTSETARNSMALATGMAKAAGVPLDKVMEDIAGASDETLSLLRGSTTELIRAAVEARRLGTNLETLGGAASKFLDFESSINAEMEASVFAGKALNFQKARQLAYEGDLVGMQREAMNVIKSAGEFTEMSYHQQQKLADAAGMTVGEINKQLTREKQLEALKHGTAEQQAMHNRYLQMQKELEEGNKKTLEEQGMEMMKQELMQSKLTQMKERFNALMVELGEKLLPLVEIGFTLLVPIVKVLFEVAKLLLMPFTLLSDVIRALTGDFSGLSERFGSFGSVAHTVLGLILGSILLIKTNFLGLGGAISSIGSLASGLWGTISGGVSSLGPALSGMFSGASSGLSTLWAGTKSFFSSAMEGAASLGTKLKDGFLNLFGGGGGGPAPPVPVPPTPDIDTDSLDSGGGIIERFNSIDMMQVIKGAAALLILAAALWVSAKAFQEFGKVTWDGVLKGVVALGVLVGGLYAIGKVMDQNADKILKGSLAIAAIGAAMLPAAYAFNMFGEVDWGGFLFGIGALGAFVVALMAIGAVMDSGIGTAAILGGVAAIALMGVAMIPAAYAMDIMSTAFRNYVDALNTLEWSSIGKILVLSLVFTAVGTLAPFIMMGAYAMMVLSGAVAILAAGVWVLSDGLSVLGPAIVSLGDSAGSLIAFAGAVSLIGYFSPSIIAGAYALGALGLAMIPVAVASILVGTGFSLLATSISEISDANLVGLVLELGLAFTLLGLMAPAIIVGALAMTVMTIALVPLAAALVVAGAGMSMFGLGLEMTMDALKDAPEAAAGLLAFAGAVSLVGALAPLIILGAVVLGILGVALAILAVPLLVVSAAMWVLGGAMKLMGDAIESMADAGAIGMILGLGAAFVFLAFTFPLIALGALSMTLMTLSLLPLSAAMFVAGLGMKMLTKGIENLKPALEELSGAGPMLDEFLIMMLKIGASAPIFLFAGIAMSMAAAGAALLGLGLMVLGTGMEIIAPPLESISESLGSLIRDLVALGEVGPGLIAAALGIGLVAVAILALGAAQVAGGIMSLFTFGKKDDPIEKFIRLGKQGPQLEAAGKAIKIFADAGDGLSGMGRELVRLSNGLNWIFDTIEDAPTNVAAKLTEIGIGMKGLLDGFKGANLSAEVDYEDALEGIADGLDEIFGVLEDIDITLAPNLSIIGDGMKGLLPAFAGDIVGNISEDIDDILEAVGDGLEEFFSSMEDIDPVVLPILPQIGPSVAELLVALGSGNLGEFDADLEDIFEELGDGLVEFMGSMSGIDPAQMEGMGGIGSAINDILSGIGEIGEINFDSDDLADIFEDMGPAIDAFLQPLKKVDDKVLEAAASVGQALGAVFGSLGAVGDNADLDWEDVLEGFGDGIEELFDEIEDIDPDSFSQAIMVGDVMAQVFASVKDVKITEDMGKGIGSLGDGIEDFFDEVEHVDLDEAPQILEVTRLLGRTISYLPMDKIGNIPEDVGDKLNELGDGIEDMMDEMEGMWIPDRESMVAVAATLRELVPAVSGDALKAIPSDIEGILNNLGDAVEDMFDEMEDIDLSVAIPMSKALGGMGTFFQGLADMSDSFVDVGVIKDMGVAFAYIVKTMSGMESGDIDADAMASRFKSLGDGMKNIMESFSEMDLSAFAGIDIGGLLGGVASGIGAMVDLVDGDNGIFGMLGGNGKSEQEQTQLFEEFSKRMKSLGDGVSSIMGSFNTDQLSALSGIDIGSLLGGVVSGIGEMIDLVDGDNGIFGMLGLGKSEEEQTKMFEQFSDRMKLLGGGVGSIMGAFSNIGSIGNVDIEDVSEDMAEGIEELLESTSDIDISDLDVGVIDQFVKISDAMNLVAEVGPQMNLTLGGLQSIASQEFVEGMANATNAIHDFALAIQGLSDIEGLSAIEVATSMEGIPKEEQVSTDEFSDFTLPTLDMSQPADTTPIIIESTPIASVSSPTTGSGNVEAKLDTLIALMKSGGISVNLDGKKVSKTLAQSIESS